jgi:RecA-family ATPase
MPVLDPQLRLQGIDENHVGAVAEWLAYFRKLQRELALSVLLVHHTSKDAADGVIAGLGLRGSGAIHAFGDSNLYLQRTKDHLILSSEQRGDWMPTHPQARRKVGWSVTRPVGWLVSSKRSNP